MFKGVIILNGDMLDYKYDCKDKIVIACDGGYEYAKLHGIKPDYILGDFDSLGYTPENAMKFNPEKDYTDFELAINLAKKLKLESIEVICCGGGREDHLLSNIGMLYKMENKFKSSVLVTNYSTITLAKGEFNCLVEPNQTVSVIAPTRAKVESSTGLKYKYNNVNLNFAKSIGISNIAIEKQISLNIVKGKVLVIINNNVV